MSQPRVLILRAPGVNCDQESAYAFQQAGARTDAVHIQSILENPAQLQQFQILCLPGGFSYGDDLGAGRILGNQIRYQLTDAMRQFREAGKLILGICNGFQILIKSGVLLDIDPEQQPPATLTNNASGKFEDRWVKLTADGSNCVFFRGIESLYLPVAHAEGRFVARDEAALRALESAGQVVLRYSSQNGHVAGDVAYPDNPNGSQRHIAGVCDTTGRVCGLMPHPERYIDRTQHPRWTRLGDKLPAEGDGLKVFQNAVAFFQ